MGIASFAIIPAAGLSRRMGRPKLLLPWRETTVIRSVLQAWVTSRVDRVFLVIRPDDPLLADHVRHCGAEVIIAPTPPEDMKASIILGLAACTRACRPGNDDCWLVAPADQPNLTANRIDAVLEQWKEATEPILVPTHGGRGGHPCVFSWSLADDVTQLPDDRGLNSLLELHPVRRWPSGDPDILQDIDTPKDYLDQRPD